MKERVGDIAESALCLGLMAGLILGVSLGLMVARAAHWGCTP